MTTDTLTVLGIESSCDETAAALVRLSPDGRTEILSDVLYTQHAEHAGYGGVVPELAARSHLDLADSIVAQALREAGMADGTGLDAVAATAGPGLIGGVMVGMMTAKALALSLGVPFVPVNHLEGHALSVRLSHEVEFPYLLLLISGGHTQLLEVAGVGQYRRLGTTIDDAAGEAFDKTAKLLSLGQPGGPRIEAAARNGNPDRFAFPRPLRDRDDCDFSFSGLKTAVRQTAEKAAPLGAQDVADLAAGLQKAVAVHLSSKTEQAMTQIGDAGRLVLAGGVAANIVIREEFTALTDRHGWDLIVPPARYCTDNGAMIALAGALMMQAQGVPDQASAMALGPRPRWPLDDEPAGARYGSGKKGPKA